MAANPENQRPFAFISYAHEDGDWAERIQQFLEEFGIRVWRDTKDLWPGDDWRIKVRQAITEASLIIACFSTRSLRRRTGYQNEELKLVAELMQSRRPEQPRLLPVRLDDCVLPPLDLGGGRTLDNLQPLDLFGGHRQENEDRLRVEVASVVPRARLAPFARELSVGQRSAPDLAARVAYPLDGLLASESPSANAGPRTAKIFLATGDLSVAEQFEEAFVELLGSFGVELSPEGPAEIGSWKRRYKIRSTRGSSDEMARRLEKIEHALEVVSLRRPMSEVNAAQADAISKLAAAADRVDEFVAIADGVLFVKATVDDGRTRTFTKTLTVAEIRELERNPELAEDPSAVLRYLRRQRQETNPAPVEGQLPAGPADL